MNWIEYIIEHQCEAVGISIDDVEPYNKDAQWYHDHTWSKEAEEGFTDWLANELYKNAEFRRSIMRYPFKTRMNCREAAEWWVWSYGWMLDK